MGMRLCINQGAHLGILRYGLLLKGPKTRLHKDLHFPPWFPTDQDKHWCNHFKPFACLILLSEEATTFFHNSTKISFP